LNGRVNSYSERYYSVIEKFGKTSRGPRLIDSTLRDQAVSLDPNGNVIQAVEYNADGSVFCVYKAIQGYSDNHIESAYLRCEPKKAIDRKDFLLESATYSWGMCCELNYKNDTNGWPVEQTVLNLMGDDVYTLILVRDIRGRAQEDSCTDGTHNHFHYDNEGRLNEQISFFANSNIIVTTFRYDKWGNLIEKKVNNFFKSTYKFQYDIFRYDYRYDRHNNWTERTDYEDDIPQRIVTRKIEYAD